MEYAVVTTYYYDSVEWFSDWELALKTYKHLKEQGVEAHILIKVK